MKSQEKDIKNALGKLIKQSIKQSTQKQMLALPSDEPESAENLQDDQHHQSQLEEKKQLHILIKIAIFLVILLLFIYTIVSISMTENKNTPIKAPVTQFFQRAYNHVKQNIPQLYIGIEKIKVFPELPLCIIIKPFINNNLKQKILESIKNQKYTNYKVLNTKKIQDKFTYKHLLSKVKVQCSQYSILLFIDQVLTPLALSAYNILYQKHNMWVSYSTSNYDIIYDDPQRKQDEDPKVLKKETIIEITSMYLRIFQLIQKNDFYGHHQEYFQQDFSYSKTKMIFMTSIFELSRFNSMHVSLDLLTVSPQLDNENQRFLFAKILKQNQPDLQVQNKKVKGKQSKKQQKAIVRIPYQTLFTLNQEYQININQFLKSRFQFYTNSKNFQASYWKKNQILPKQIKLASSLQQLPSLSPNHSLFSIDKLHMEQKYNISNHQKNQLPLCVCVFSYNYENKDRYKRALKSISIQKYENYRIVFFDDASTDGTFQKTIDYLKQLKFPKNKITLIQNSIRKFQTYNILNAAFNYCKDNEIKLVIDADDQLIGQYVFQFINSQYHDSSLWVMHNLDKNEKLQEGFNVPWSDDYIYTFLGRRRWMNFFSPLRSWLVKLIRRLPTRQHKTALSDNFFDSNYDIGLQYGLREMSGQTHSKYVPQINYLSPSYEINDEQHTLYDKIREGFIHFFVSLRQPVKTALTLVEISEVPLIKQILSKGKNTEYKKVQYQP